jgi:hypothetical protein
VHLHTRTCTYTDNMRNEQKGKYYGEFETNKQGFLGRVSGAQIYLFGQTTLNK